MPEIKLDTSDIDERFWEANDMERSTFEKNKRLPLSPATRQKNLECDTGITVSGKITV